MIRQDRGFTLVELMVTMVIFVLAIAAASNIFSGLLNQFKQQSKIAETNIEGLVGLEMMRADIQQAGFGLPWNLESDANESGDDDWTALANYDEAASDAGGGGDPADASYYNDGAPASLVPVGGLRAPRAILAENDGGPVMGTGANTWNSDRLVVKATSIGVNDVAPKWTRVTNENTAGGNANVTHVWGDVREDLVGTDFVTVIRPSMGAGGAQRQVLITNGPSPLYTTFTQASNNNQDIFEPGLDTLQTHLIYGINAATAAPPGAPFNRADFYVSRPADIPAQCSPNTGILYKARLNYADGGLLQLPLLDCVADMQVVLLTDINDDGLLEWQGQPGMNHWTTGLTAEQIRTQVREVRIYILAHEGQRDTSFTFANFSAGCGVANCLRVGDFDPGGALMGREFDLSWTGANFANYRWKIYTMSAQLPNLR